MRVAPALLLWLVLAGFARADDAINPEITDFKLVTVQIASPNDPNFIDGTANKYKFIRVIFSSSVDLAALSHSRNRDVHVGAYKCEAGRNPHASYAADPPVYDAYGAVTKDRSVKPTSELEKFRGLYYFFLPTSGSYSRGTSYVFQTPYDLYDTMENMCFSVSGSADTFFSNEVYIPASVIKPILERPH